MKMTQLYTQFCSSLYNVYGLIITQAITAQAVAFPEAPKLHDPKACIACPKYSPCKCIE
jgi:hypothetical protein